MSVLTGLVTKIIMSYIHVTFKKKHLFVKSKTCPQISNSMLCTQILPVLYTSSITSTLSALPTPSDDVIVLHVKYLVPLYHNDHFTTNLCSHHRFVPMISYNVFENIQ